MAIKNHHGFHHFVVAAFVFLLLPAAVYGSSIPVRIGVLANRGDSEALKMWLPTATYLSERIPPYHFEIVPLDFREIGPAVKKNEVDFVLANTSIYVELEALYSVTRIVTLKNLRGSGAYSLFGGVIFCRADRPDIGGLGDLRDKSFMAVDETSLGGWRMAWLEFRKNGIDPYRDFKRLRFGGTQDAVVYSVRDGSVDAGTVRTDTIERMSAEGLIDPAVFRIINQKHADNFPFALSTPLYPEWPFAKLRHTPDQLARKTAIALLSMPSESAAAKAAHIAGWTTPLNYQSVHELMRELKIGPYKNAGRVSLGDVLRKYWYLFLLAVCGLAGMAVVTAYVTGLNRRLKQSKLEAEEMNGKLLAKNEELKETRGNIQRLVDSSLDMIIAVDKNRNITEFNMAAQQAFGYTIEEALGRHVDMLYDDPATGVRIHEALREQGSFAGEVVNRRKDGEKFTCFISASVLFDSSGRRAGSMGISRDVTEHKKIEEHLMKLYQAVEQSPNSIIITGTNSSIEYVNSKFTEVTGYEQYEVFGLGMNTLESGLTPSETYEELWDTVKNGREWHGELASRKKDGAVYWESASISPVRNSEGIITNFVAFKTDITERKLLEERLRQILTEHQIILENANIGIALVKGKMIIQVNKKFEEMFGYQRDEITGRPAELLYPDNESMCSLKEEGQLKALVNEQSYATELLMKRKNDTLFWCRLFGKAIDLDDISKGAIWILDDITEQKEAEEKLRMQQNQLKELNRTLEKIVAEEVAKSREKDRLMLQQAHLADLGKLAASITHEINTPMTYIKGNIELLKMTLDDTDLPSKEELDKYFDPIEDGIKRVSHIIESMKHISGFSKKDKVEVNLFHTLVYANRMVHNRAKHISGIYINGRLFDLNMDKGEEVFMAEVAAQSIERVWIIILNNALDELSKSDIPFAERYVKIGISKEADGRALIAFRDNAGGIPAEMLDRMFEMFASTKPQSGMGIGLSMAKTIIEDHDGTIRAYNDEHGAVFEILL